MAFSRLKASAETDEFSRHRLEFFFKRTREELHGNQRDVNALINLRDHPAGAATLWKYREAQQKTLVEHNDPDLPDYERLRFKVAE